MIEKQTTTKRDAARAVKGAIAEFRKALLEGIAGFVRASEIYVDSIRENPRNADRFQEELADMIPPGAWKRFEAVGKGALDPRLLLGVVGDKKKASLIERMPPSMQTRILNGERFPLLVSGGESLEVNLMDATFVQASQLLGSTSVRDLSQQRAWLESRKKGEGAGENDAEAETMPYIITGGTVVFRRGCRMSRSEIKRLLTEM